jgi:hypothetical protein
MICIRFLVDMLASVMVGLGEVLLARVSIE